ncbi:MBL fold metallo-hydrolase [Candidatus Curtissbacteria bacterium]|nr:MBL fold metallo-hydrolase [Candidatus Curtissbacteria bacterium]
MEICANIFWLTFGTYMVDIWWYGQACFRIKGKSASVVVDPYDSNFTGLPKLKLEGDVVCVTHQHEDHNNVTSVKSAEGKEPFVISGPGEYETSGVNIVGVPSFHDDKEGAERGKNTIYNISIDDVDIVHLGDLGQKALSQAQLEILSNCDILLIPVGGVFTISGKDAPDIIAELEPKIIVPMHYKVEGLKFPLEEVSAFLTAMGKEKAEALPKLSVSRERLPEEREVVLLERQ